jgi:ADP-ribosylglycohydrolase
MDLMRTVNDDGVFPLSRRGLRATRGPQSVTHRHHRAQQGAYAGVRAVVAAGVGE